MAKVGRPKEFDEDDLVDAAKAAFWMHGYRATSLRAIAEQSGVLPGSIHQSYGSKHELFLAALQSYADDTAAAAAALRGADAPLEAVRELIAAAVDHAADSPGAGCMLGNTAAELLPADPDIQRIVSQAFDSLRLEISEALQAAAERGLLDDRADCDAYAEVILAVVQGLHITSRASSDLTHARHVADTVIDLLSGRPSPSAP
jgi:TetR/AcrR family transcriptional repressor of nem operon